jgi:ABC-2 type transport system permease protein
MSVADSSILTERIWRTWDRVRATGVHPLEVLIGKAVPVIAALLSEQAVVIVFGVGVLGLTIRGLPLLVLALLAWTSALVGMGAAIGLLVGSLSAIGASYDIGGMILSSLGGALVPLTVMPLWIRHVAPASPGYWAVTALEAALRDNAGRTFAASGVLLGFALAACLVAARRASRGWGRSARL